MTSEELQVISFEIILASGNARTLVHEAFASMRMGKFIEASEKLEEANNEVLIAHKTQTKLLQEYANGGEIKLDIITVHAQDHLMTTITLREIALEMLYLYQKK